MNKLNGWHRIFVVVALLWCIFVYVYGNGLFGNRLQKVYETSFVMHELKKFPKADLIDSNRDLFRPWPYADRTMPDGVVVHVYKDFTNSEIEVAYQRVQPSIKAAKRKLLQDYLFKTALICFLPLLGLYAFGWAVGWIRRGFNQKSLSN
jgi:hypothetical protein